MDKVMTVEMLYDMLVAERKDAQYKWDGFEEEEEKALAIGDHGRAALYRKHAKRWRNRYIELGKILNEVYRIECHWRRTKEFPVE